MRRIPLSAIIGMILTGAFILSAVLADFIAPYDATSWDRLQQRGAALLPVGQQLGDGARVHHRTGQDVRAGFRALLDDDDRCLGL